MIIQTTNLSTPQAAQPEARVSVASAAPAKLPAASAPPADPGQTASPEAVKQAVSAINQALQQSSRNLEFSVDSDTAQTVVRLFDTSTGELIRQYPSEATIAIAREIEAMQQGLLLKQEV
jgi:flagellar protein FlaG